MWQTCLWHRLWASSRSSFHMWSTLKSSNRWGTTQWPLLHFLWPANGLSSPALPTSFFIVHPINQLSVPPGPVATRLRLSKILEIGKWVGSWWNKLTLRAQILAGTIPEWWICHRYCLQIYVLWNLYNRKPTCADIGSSEWKIKRTHSALFLLSLFVLLLLVIIGSPVGVIQSWTWEVTLDWRGSHVVHSSNLYKGCYFIETASSIGMASPLWSGHSQNLCCNHCYDFSLWGHCLIFTLSDLCCPPIQKIFPSGKMATSVHKQKHCPAHFIWGSFRISLILYSTDPTRCFFVCTEVLFHIDSHIESFSCCTLITLCWSTSQECFLDLVPVTLEASGIQSTKILSYSRDQLEQSEDFGIKTSWLCKAVFGCTVIHYSYYQIW